MIFGYFLVPMSCSDKQSESYVNIVEFAKMERDTQGIILYWEEPRDIYKVVVKTSNPSKLSENKLQYWQNYWPKQRIPKGKVVGGGSGWTPIDDWFNGRWQDADTKMEIRGDRIVYTFNPVNMSEFPKEDFDAVYRNTLKIRLPIAKDSCEVQGIEVFTNSLWREHELKIEWGENFAKENFKGHFVVYNGKLENIEALSDNVIVQDEGQCKFQCDSKGGSVKLRLRYTINEDSRSSDRTIVTFRSDVKSFSFLVNEVASGEKIFMKDYDVLITELADDINYAEFRQKWESDHAKTLYDRIKDLPEQTYEKAKNEMPEKRERGYMPLGCEGGRQKFGVDVNGNVFCRKSDAFNNDPGKDSERLLWEGNRITYRFGFPDVEPAERYLEDGYLPIINTTWKDNAVAYKQTAFVTLLSSNILSKERMQGDEPTILVAKVTLTNLGDESKEVKLNLRSHSDIEEKLTEKDGFVLATDYEPFRMRFLIDTGGKGSLKREDGNSLYKINLARNESHNIYIKIPCITLSKDEELKLVKNIDYDREFLKVKDYWKNRVSKGTRIITPNETLNNFYKAHITHMLITDDREVGSDRYASRVGTFAYDVYPNESCMCISDFSRRNYKKEAEERLEMFVHYQGSRPLPGNYTDKNGVLYGTAGYTAGGNIVGTGYNQHHGWVLWCLAEHYLYYRDKEWLKKVSPAMIKACDWIIRQRQNTMNYDEDGDKVLEYGFLPAGKLEDVNEHRYWLATNAYTYMGFNNAVKALKDINHPESLRLSEELKKYKEDLVRGYTESMIISPVVKLRDGTYIPYVPSSLYGRGRALGWIREVLEGSIHLIRCGIFEPWDEISTWIIKDHEDNLYITDKSVRENEYGYAIENFDKNWFSQGGFSMQSNLLCNPVPYIFRDEPKHYLRAYFNAFESVFYPDICACVEHALPTLADNNGVWFKPSDEAQSTFWLRMMFVRENGDDLFLGQSIPRDWLTDGNNIGIQSALTHFGLVSFSVKSQTSQDKITVILNPPQRNAPENIYLRLRHPTLKPIRNVTVNGKEYKKFDAKQEWVILPGELNEDQEIVVHY